MALRLVAAATLVALCGVLTSCGPENTSGVPGPRPTIPARPSPEATPDARSVKVEPLIPEGATIEKVLYGRLLPGEGEQIVVHSTRDISARGGAASGGGCSDRQDYLQVFAFDKAFGEWKALFEADRAPLPDAAFIPDREDLPDPCKGYEHLELVELADVDEDEGTQELVLALATSTASEGTLEPGPLLLKVLSLRMGVAEIIYDEATTRGGAARLAPPGRITLEQDTYPLRSSPLWCGRSCPNGTLTEVIGWDEQYRQVDVLESSLALFCRHGIVDEVKSKALIVTCDADGRQRYTGYRLTDETRVLPREFGGLGEIRVGQEVSVSEAEPLGLGEDWELEPIATEVRVLSQRYARLPPPEADGQAAGVPAEQREAGGGLRLPPLLQFLVAERVGFEPTDRLRGHALSRRA